MTLPPAPPAVAGFDAYELLDVPVALTDAQGRVLAVNAAFVDFGGHAPERAQGQRLDELLCADLTDAAMRLWLAQQLRGGRSFAPVDFDGRDARGRPLHCRIGQRQLPDGRCLATLQPTGLQQRYRQESQRLAELLELTQQHGRIGVWERDLKTGAGRWDAHVWRLWGLPPGDGAPRFEDALAQVVPEDRAAISATFEASARRAGTHAARFRVRGADGQLHHLRSQWLTRAGRDGVPEHALGILMDDTEAYQLARSYGDTHAQLRLAMEVADAMVWRHDTATQRIFSNDRGWAMLQLPPQPDGLPLRRLFEAVHPDDLGEARRRLAAAADHAGPVEVSARWQRPDGQMRSLLMRCMAHRNEAGECIGHLGVTLDLTERFRQSQRERELDRRLEMATSAAGVAIWTQRLDTGEMHWDEQMRRLHGGRDALVAADMDAYQARYLHPDDRAAANEAVRLLLARRTGLVDLDLRILRPDGSVRRVASRTSFEDSPQGPMLYGVMLDITDRHATEIRLRDAAERAALVARGAGIGTWETDLEGERGHWDAQMFRLRGREPRDEPVDAAERSEWVHPDDREAAIEEMARAIREDRPSNTVFRVVWPDGSVRWLASRSVPLRDEQGRTTHRIGINWDVTDAHAAGEARQQTELALRESQAKSQFMARMSHELRTPLNAVLGFAQLLLSDAGDEPGQRQRRVEHILTAGEHLLALINDVLDLSSLETGELPLQLVPVALAPLVASVLPLVEGLAQRHHVALQFDATMGGSVLADPMRLRQVLINLVVNAIKYNRPGGTVRIFGGTAAGTDGTATGSAGSALPVDEPLLLLHVEDNGRGMTPEQVEHVFEPFNRLGAERESIDGTGIGLAIVQATVRRIGGAVRVRSEPDVGSRFTLQLRAAQAPGHGAGASIRMPEPPTGAMPATPTATTGARRQLLYIEDNPVNMMIVAELIERRGDLQLATADDGRSGIAHAQALLPELILIDMQLPDLDGCQVLQALRADPRTAGIRCVALSANAMADDIRTALAAGFDDYWTKPLDFRKFLGALEQWFGPAPHEVRLPG